MAAVHILIFGEMAGFKIVPFIAIQVKMIFFFFMELWKKKISQSELVSLHENNLILNYLTLKVRVEA